jgi:hypothetical protein
MQKKIAPQKKIKSIDLSEIIYTYVPTTNKYIRSAAYRKLAPKDQKGTNSEIY